MSLHLARTSPIRWMAPDFGDIEYENFYGASLTVDIKGVSTHPGEAKDKMKNASLIAMEFDALLPPWERPEHTQDYEGFYHLMHISGDCGHCQMNYHHQRA